MLDPTNLSEFPSSHWVYVPVGRLNSVQLQHVYSVVAPSITHIDSHPFLEGPTAIGRTEWSGEWCDAQVFLRWQWGQMLGVLAILNPTEFRTNIVPIEDSGEPVPPRLVPAYLLDFIETLSWRDHVWTLLAENDVT